MFCWNTKKRLMLAVTVIAALWALLLWVQNKDSQESAPTQSHEGHDHDDHDDHEHEGHKH
jgi:hypothetical protein